MANIIIKKSALQATVNKSVTSRILLDLSTNKGKDNIVAKQFTNEVEKITNRIVNRSAEGLAVVVRKDFFAGMTEVGNSLRTGFEGIDDGETVQPPAEYPLWKPYTHKYYLRKKKNYAANTTKFWKRSGDLSRAYGAFALRYRTAVLEQKALVTLKSRGFKYRGTRLRYQIDFRMPDFQPNNKALATLFHKSFFTGLFQPIGPGGLGLNTLAKIGYLEGQSVPLSGQRYRPFISKMMAVHGKANKVNIDKFLKLNVKAAQRK